MHPRMSSPGSECLVWQNARVEKVIQPGDEDETDGEGRKDKVQETVVIQALTSLGWDKNRKQENNQAPGDKAPKDHRCKPDDEAPDKKRRHSNTFSLLTNVREAIVHRSTNTPQDLSHATRCAL